MNRKDRAERRLSEEVGRYVRLLGGNVVLTSGIEIQTWPGDRAMEFRVAIRCMGRKPVVPEGKEPGDG